MMLSFGGKASDMVLASRTCSSARCQTQAGTRLCKRTQLRTSSSVCCRAAAADTSAICSPEKLQSIITQFFDRDGLEPGPTFGSLYGYLQRLGCTQDQLNTAVAQLNLDVPAQATGPFTVDVKVYALEILVALLAAAAIRAYQQRPRGWVRRDLVYAKESSIHGKGVFAAVPIAKGTVIGAYPGQLRSGSEMAAKVQAVPAAKDYVFQTGNGCFLDPTDAQGSLISLPQLPSLPLLTYDPLLALVNEPPKGAGGTNCSLEDGADESDVLFVACKDIEPGQELFIDYGSLYDRSKYV